MINIFIYPNNPNFFKLLSIFSKKPYKENQNIFSLNIENHNFNKLIKMFNPEKITYESLVFYSKNSEHLKEMVLSDFNLLIFNSLNEANQFINQLKERDLNIIQEHYNSKSFKKDPSNKEKIQEIENYIQKFPNISIEESVNINSQYKQIITLLNILTVKKNLIIIDDHIEQDSNSIILNAPISIIVEIKEIEDLSEAKEFIELYGLPDNLDQKIEEIILKIRDIILKHWIIFYTGNKKEVKQYLVPINTDVLEASGKIHTDLKEKFIQADIYDIEKMKDNKLPSPETVGKTYIVKNHNYLHIKASK